MSLLQDIARERNWLKWFICKNVTLHPIRKLKLSEVTMHQLNRVNREIQYLRDHIDLDWKTQRQEEHHRLTQEFVVSIKNEKKKKS